jgi:hypothetical protein
VGFLRGGIEVNLDPAGGAKAGVGCWGSGPRDSYAR